MQFFSSSPASTVVNPMKAGSDLVGGPHRQMASGRHADSANASDHPSFNECEWDDYPLTPMPRVPRPMIVSTETPGSVCSIPSLSLTTDSKHMDSDTTSTLEGTICRPQNAMELNHLRNRIICDFQPEEQHIHKDMLSLWDFQPEEQDIHEDMLSLTLAQPGKGKQSPQNSVSIYACNGLGTLATEDKSISERPIMQHQNVYRPVPSRPHYSLDSRAMNMASTLESSRNMPKRLNSAQCTPLYMVAGRERICGDMLQYKETAGSAEITPRSAKGGSVVSRQPVTLGISILKREDSFGSSFIAPCITNTQSAGTNNFSVKGLKYIQMPPTPMEANFDRSSKGNLCLSNGNNAILERKRKSNCALREANSRVGFTDENRYFLKARCQPEGADDHQRVGERHCQNERQHGHIKFPSYYPPYYPLSKYCKKHKAFADKVEPVLPDPKTLNGIIEPQNKNIPKAGWLLPQSQASELNGNGLVYPSVNLMRLHSLGDSEGTSTKPLSNQTDIRSTMKQQSLQEDSSQAIGLSFGSLEYAASEKKTPHKISSLKSDWGKFLAVSSASPQVEPLEKETSEPYQHRFKRLQAFLRKCDESEEYYCQTLRFLSAAGRNARAVELENRAIRLSLEEDKELQRMTMLDVFGKNSGGSSKGKQVLDQC